MTRAQLRTFIESGVSAITPAVDYGSGLLTDWNSNRSNEYPGVWFESVESVDVDLPFQTLPQDAWPIKLHIGKLDKMDSSPEQYEAIIDESDTIAQQLIFNYSQGLADTENVSITEISRIPFVKKRVDCVSGVILAFTLNVPDGTDLC